MEPNQVNPSPETSGIPQGIPTGVFVPNNQTPSPAVSSPAPTPVQNTAPAQVQSSVAAPVVASEGPLDKFFKWIIRFIAKITGQPDPITGAPNIASQAIQKGQNIVGKARDVANQAVEKAGDVTGKAVDIATNVATQAAQQVQQIIPPPVAAPQQTTPTEPMQAPTEPVK